jgi:hypothetical protein
LDYTKVKTNLTAKSAKDAKKRVIGVMEIRKAPTARSIQPIFFANLVAVSSRTSRFKIFLGALGG